MKAAPRHLYVHIPFCVRKCFYCDYSTFAIGKTNGLPMGHVNNLQSSYIDTLELEMKHYISLFHPDLKRSLDTLYIGGGTPSLLSTSNLKKLSKSLRSFYPDLEEAKEFTFECEPGTVDADKLDFIVHELGANRISLGGQSTSPEVLQRIGRSYQPHELEVAVDIAESILGSRDAINLDFLIGVPGESPEQIYSSLEGIIRLNPGHISAYLLEIASGTPFGKKYTPGHKDLLSDDDTEKVYMKCVQILLENGYSQYQISSFSKTNRRCMHNMMYWECEKDFIGLGTGAGGMIASQRYKNPHTIPKWKTHVASLTHTSSSTTPKMPNIEDYLIGKLLTTNGLSESVISSRFPSNFSKITKILESKIDPEYFDLTPERIRLTLKGMLRADAIMLQIVSDLDE